MPGRGNETHFITFVDFSRACFSGPLAKMFRTCHKHSMRSKSPVSVWKARFGVPFLDLKALSRGLWTVWPRGHYQLLRQQVLASSVRAWVQLSGVLCRQLGFLSEVVHASDYSLECFGHPKKRAFVEQAGDYPFWPPYLFLLVRCIPTDSHKGPTLRDHIWPQGLPSHLKALVIPRRGHCNLVKSTVRFLRRWGSILSGHRIYWLRVRCIQTDNHNRPALWGHIRLQGLPFQDAFQPWRWLTCTELCVHKLGTDYMQPFNRFKGIKRLSEYAIRDSGQTAEKQLLMSQRPI